MPAREPTQAMLDAVKGWDSNTIIHSDTARDLWVAMWDAHVRATSETHVLVPKEPTEAMVQVGAASFDRMTVHMGGPPEGLKRKAKDMYRAMLETASTTPLA